MKYNPVEMKNRFEVLSEEGRSDGESTNEICRN